MSPEELERRVNTAIEVELVKGFKLRERTFGCNSYGCALTALYLHEIPAERRALTSDIGASARDWAKGILGVEQTAAFANGFDLSGEIDSRGDHMKYMEAGLRVRKKWAKYLGGDEA